MEGLLRKFIFSGVIVIGIMLIVAGTAEIFLSASSNNWQETALHVDNVTITHVAETDNYDLFIFYTYTAEGKEYSNMDGKALYYNTYHTSTEALDAAEALNGTDIRIYYNPDNPEQFSFSKGVDLITFIPIVLGVAVTIPAISILWKSP